MPDEKGNLYVFEAIELRNEFDRHIKILEKMLAMGSKNEDQWYGRSGRDETAEQKPADDFKPDELEEKLKKLQTRRVKLNQAIQRSNFEAQITFQGEMVSIAEAVELRKNLLVDLNMLGERVGESAYKKIVHKEERDVVINPRYSFSESYNEYQEKLKSLRHLVTQIHASNHASVVNFKDE